MWIINPGVAYWGVSSSVYLMRLQSSYHPGLHGGKSASMFPQEPFHSLSEWFYNTADDFSLPRIVLQHSSWILKTCTQ